MTYFTPCCLIGFIFAMILSIVIFISTNRLRSKRRNQSANNKVIKALYKQFERLDKNQFRWKYRKEYTRILKKRDIDQIQHACDLLETSIGITVFTDIIFTIVVSIVSKIALFWASFIADSIKIPPDSSLIDMYPEGSSIIEIFMILPFLIFVVYYLYICALDYQRDKYLIRIMNEELDRKKKATSKKKKSKVKHHYSAIE